MYYLKITLKPHWGFLINYFGFTKSRPAIKIIPPTTLIGALAFSLNLGKGEVYNDYSAAEKIRRIFKGIHLKVDTPLLEYNDLNRVVFYKVREKKIVSDAVAVGKIYSVPVGYLKIIYLIDRNEARNILGEEWFKELIVSAWSICRIGARESIVSVVDVEASKAEIIDDKFVKTSFYFPLRASDEQCLRGEFIIFNVIDWTSYPIGDYTLAPKIPVVFPYSESKMKSSEVETKLKKGYKAVNAGGDIIIPWRM